MSHKNGSFSSSLGFVLACVGSAVGLGNIWMFPYRLGQYGGAAFLVPYIFFVVLFGLTGLSAEFAIGRRARTGTLGSYELCWGDGQKDGGKGNRLDSAYRVSGNCDRLLHYHRMGAALICRLPDRKHSEHRFCRIFFSGYRQLRKPALAYCRSSHYHADPAHRLSYPD